jgi:glycerol uptake facilitator-like aquaporin
VIFQYFDYSQNMEGNEAVKTLAALAQEHRLKVFRLLGAFAGVAAAHLMFGEPLFFASSTVRTSASQWWSEFVATFGLLMVIWRCVRQQLAAVPYAVAAYITVAYWFTASTSFANPAVTVARAASNTFAGIRPADVAAFVVAQMLGAAAATLLFRWLLPSPPPAAGSDTICPARR